MPSDGTAVVALPAHFSKTLSVGNKISSLKKVKSVQVINESVITEEKLETPEVNNIKDKGTTRVFLSSNTSITCVEGSCDCGS